MKIKLTVSMGGPAGTFRRGDIFTGTEEECERLVDHKRAVHIEQEKEPDITPPIFTPVTDKQPLLTPPAAASAAPAQIPAAKPAEKPKAKPKAKAKTKTKKTKKTKKAAKK